MSQLVSVQNFSDSGPDANVNGSRLDSHVNDALLLNGAVLDQTEKTTPVSADALLLGDSTVAASGYPKKVLLANLLLESQRNGSQQYVASDTGAANAYAAALSPAATAYNSGMVVRFKAANASTGASTLNVNSLGVKTIKTPAGNDTGAGDIAAGQVVHLVYDGTYFQMVPGPVTAALATENFRTQASAYAADGGAADAYTMTLTPAPTAYAAGMTVRFVAANANTGASTLNVNSLGLKSIKKIVAGAAVALVAKDIQAGDMVECVYDGTQFQITSRVRSWDFIDTPQNAPASSGALVRAHGLGIKPSKYQIRLVQTNSSTLNGYPQNDEIDYAGCHSDSTKPLFTVSVDATNVTVVRSDGAGAYLYPKGGGAVANITTNINTPNFDYKVKIYASI